MKSLINFLHVGYPKSMSTSFQRDFFPQLESTIYYLGVGCPQRQSNIDYIDDNINLFFEYYVRFANDLVFEEKIDFFQDVFHQHRKKAIEHKKNSFGASLELLSFKFLAQDIHTKQKILRLKQVFPKDTKVIFVIRNQFDLLRSLYRENLKNGMILSFQEFMEYCYYFQESNFVYDFLYNKTIKMYESVLEADVQIILFEDLKSERQEKELNRIAHIIGGNSIEKRLQHFNNRQESELLFVKQKQNIVNRHDLGVSNYEQPELHRLRRYFHQRYDYQNEDIYRFARTKNASLEYSKKMASYHSMELSYEVDPSLVDKLAALFRESNQNLVKQYDIQLPDCYFNLKL